MAKDLNPVGTGIVDIVPEAGLLTFRASIVIIAHLVSLFDVLGADSFPHGLRSLARLG